ncbi:DUF6415 family natural product biosynthesis protein [Streptomyces sp. NPDC005483]|uniref:DUF6415 family natural product biosynthesis protein n=1 Tax=Streptomyces sp. NPDC005483 TaxID=3154882 RepID=UPI0033A35BA3
MSHSTEQRQAAQQAELDDLIAEAQAATGILPTIDRCEEMRDALLAHITELADQVRRRLAGFQDGAPEWQRHKQALLQAQGALTGSFGRGLRSAALHVQTLGEAAAVLDDCMRDD